jgi:phospholipase C
MRLYFGALIALQVFAPDGGNAQPAGGFKHIIVVVQENRTPDNIFGSDPGFEAGVDIACAGKNSLGAKVKLQTTPLAGCYDISHSHQAFVAMYAHGSLNGADLEPVSTNKGCRLPNNPQFKFIGNATGDVQPYFDIAEAYGFANRMFQTQQGPSFPAHQFIFGGTSAPTEASRSFASENMSGARLGVGCIAGKSQRVTVIDDLGVEHKPGVYPCFDRETMADLLDADHLSWSYYTNIDGHVDTSALWDAPLAISRLCEANGQGGRSKCVGTNYVRHVLTEQARVLTDIAKCTLPAVSWVIPDAADSDHAGINKGAGPSWVASIVNAVGQQPACSAKDNYWNDTAILITWDDWGGWYDHVPPFALNGQPNGWGAGYTYGFRVPLLVVSAYTPAHTVDNTVHDFGSLLAFIESNFGLGHIGAGNYADAYADKLAGFFTLGSPRSFKTIKAKFSKSYFLHAARSLVGPDDD